MLIVMVQWSACGSFLCASEHGSACEMSGEQMDRQEKRLRRLAEA